MPTTTLTPQQILNFYTLAEKLKTTLRHSWLSEKNRQESVAEHTWMMGVLAVILMPQMKQKLDEQKVLKMILIHDLAEAVTADMPVWQGQQNKVQKEAAEREAIHQIFQSIDSEISQELLQIWEEYEERTSFEARFVKAIDTLDVITQHNLAPIESWDDNDYLWQISSLQDAFFDVDPFLRQIKDTIDEWSIEKVAKVHNLDKLDQIELKKRNK